MRVHGIGVWIVLATALVRGWAGTDENPYAYDVSAFATIPPALCTYRELPPLPALVDKPHAIAVDAAARVYVGGESELAVLNPDGTPAARFPLAYPAHALAVMPGGAILVGTVDHIDVYGPTGGVSETWVGFGERAVVTSLALFGNRVFAADAGTRVVWRLDDTGRLLGAIGANPGGGANKHFVIPSPYFDVMTSATGEVWIANSGRHRLERYTVDGQYQSAWGDPGMGIEGFAGCCNPVHAALLPDGAMVTSEKGLPRIKVFNSAGVLTAVVAGPGTLCAPGAKPDAGQPCSVLGPGLDLAVDAGGRILALDSLRGTVRVFEENPR